MYAVKLIAAPADADRSEARRAGGDSAAAGAHGADQARDQVGEDRSGADQDARRSPSTEAPAKATASTEKPNPGETPSTGNAVANVETPGQEFPYPQYLERIVNEIYRRWQRPAGSPALRAQVQFTILRDGTVKEIRVIARSRSYSFDLGAQGAVEAAGQRQGVRSAAGGIPERGAADRALVPAPGGNP